MHDACIFHMEITILFLLLCNIVLFFCADILIYRNIFNGKTNDDVFINPLNPKV